VRDFSGSSARAPNAAPAGSSGRNWRVWPGVSAPVPELDQLLVVPVLWKPSAARLGAWKPELTVPRRAIAGVKS
jgi:hypothetical protein